MPHSRRHSRHPVRFPVAIESPAKPGRVGVVRNLSQRGLLLGTPSRYQPGQRVRVRFKTRGGGPEYDLPATVVRIDHDPSGDWLSRLVALEFDRDVSERRLDELRETYQLFSAA
ncbi:MAG: PilZ domain-containing protein [Polyangiaceae bacterium]|nr:PilZ domain-containing protein [Polyangiaceae bacterium]MBK8998885.1 PilZ domain-containing protein [Myxococcales bacterium]MCE7894192.1 PilZ domain-containing protein [Sorangiineae bacterium PRO1]MCL4753050.1 PilZ domain-containing protein [Myxococcales bacterium]